MEKPNSTRLPNNPNPRLFVGSLPYNYTEGELLSLFVPFGRIISLKIMHNQWGKSRGLGFIEFDNLESAIEAKKHLHNFIINDRSIIVDYAQPDPFKTEEGFKRHEEALVKKGSKLKSQNNPKPLQENQPRHPNDRPYRPKVSYPSGDHQRQSIYDSRHHGARIGAKFSRRNKKNG